MGGHVGEEVIEANAVRGSSLVVGFAPLPGAGRRIARQKLVDGAVGDRRQRPAGAPLHYGLETRQTAGIGVRVKNAILRHIPRLALRHAALPFTYWAAVLCPSIRRRSLRAM